MRGLRDEGDVAAVGGDDGGVARLAAGRAADIASAAEPSEALGRDGSAGP